MNKHLLHRWSALKLFDKIIICFILILNGLILLFHSNVQSPLLRFLLQLIIIFAILYVIPLIDSENNKFLYFLRNWYIIFTITFIYWGVGDLIHLVSPHLFDQYIISFEETIFAQLPNIWIQEYENPVLTELMQISYAVYWFTIPVGAAIFYFTKSYDIFEYMLFFTLATFFLSYLFFIFIPVAGPRFIIMDEIHVSYEGLFLTPFLRSFVEEAGLRGGAFPSSHVAVAIVILSFVWKYYPKTGKRVFLPAVIALSVATVYGQYHYLTDVVAGAAMGVLIGNVGIRYAERKLGKGINLEVQHLKT